MPPDANAVPPVGAVAVCAAPPNPFPRGSIEAMVYTVGTKPEHLRRLEAYWKTPQYVVDMHCLETARVESARRTAAGEQPWQQPGWNVTQ